MLPALILIITVYCITRLAEMIGKKENHIILKFVAGAAILIIIVQCIAVLHQSTVIKTPNVSNKTQWSGPSVDLDKYKGSGSSGYTFEEYQKLLEESKNK